MKNKNEMNKKIKHFLLGLAALGFMGCGVNQTTPGDPNPSTNEEFRVLASVPAPDDAFAYIDRSIVVQFSQPANIETILSSISLTERMGSVSKTIDPAKLASRITFANNNSTMIIAPLNGSNDTKAFLPNTDYILSMPGTILNISNRSLAAANLNFSTGSGIDDGNIRKEGPPTVLNVAKYSYCDTTTLVVTFSESVNSPIANISTKVLLIIPSGSAPVVMQPWVFGKSNQWAIFLPGLSLSETLKVTLLASDIQDLDGNFMVSDYTSKTFGAPIFQRCVY